MIDLHPSRRSVLSVAGTAGGIAAIGAGAFYVSNASARAAYQDAAASTWGGNASGDPLRQLVHSATLAANSHNTQPWRFRLSGQSILVLPDFERRLLAVDPDNHHLFASLGCAVENIVQVAGALGLLAQPVFDRDAGGIQIDLGKAPQARSALFDAIARRQSTRALYDGRPAPTEHLRLLEAAGNGKGVEMLLFTEVKQREAILSPLIAGNGAQIDDAAFMRELKSWIRFSYGDAIATRDGLFAKASGNPALPGWIGRTAFDWLFTKNAENRKYEQQLRSSAGIAVFVSDKNEPDSWIEAGRASQRFALQATALNLKHAYINQPVEVPAVRAQFSTYLGIGGRRPDLVMRFGYGPDLPRSLRRPVEQVLL